MRMLLYQPDLGLAQARSHQNEISLLQTEVNGHVAHCTGLIYPKLLLSQVDTLCTRTAPSTAGP